MRNNLMWLLGRRGIAALVVSIVCLAVPAPGRADQVIPDDLIVQGSECVGLDCVNNESFGFDTIRLKENNLRIKFDDTSTGSFPSNDWQITANDSASGGANKFSIDDITNARTPFTILAGAPTNSLFIDGIGRIGLRTATPALDLHFNTSNTPGIRLEQNSSVGFATQTWDVAGNEANFFIRDVTRGSRLPFRIRPGAPTSSIDINGSGNVGLGTASPQTKLHVVRSGGAFTPNAATTMVIQDNANANGNNSRAILSLISGNASTGQVNFGDTDAEFRGRIVYSHVAESLELHANGALQLSIRTTDPAIALLHANGARLTKGGV